MRKLYISILTFFLVSFVATTVTYAWLSLSTVNSIENIILTTSSDEELLISVDGINYYHELPNETIQSLISNIKFKDVTSIDGINFKLGINNSESIATKNRDYLSIDFYFKTKNPYAHEVFLINNVSNDITYQQTKNGTFVTSRGVVWEADQTFQYGPNQIIEKGSIQMLYAKDAIRVAFNEQKWNDEDLRNTFKQKIFDLTEDEERGFGKFYGAFDYYLKKAGAIELPDIAPKTVMKLSEFSHKEPYALDDNSHILTLIRTDERHPSGLYYYQGKVTMTIWLEGWDADLFDAILGDRIKMQFEFKAVHGIKND